MFFALPVATTDDGPYHNEGLRGGGRRHMRTEGSTIAACVVYDREGNWATQLKARFGGTEVSLLHGPSLEHCWHALEQFPASVVLLVAGKTNLGQVFDAVRDMRTRFPDSRSIVALPREDEELGWSLREVGAIHVTCSTEELEWVARIVVRHLARVPGGHRDVFRRILSRLPWHP